MQVPRARATASGRASLIAEEGAHFVKKGTVEKMVRVGRRNAPVRFPVFEDPRRPLPRTPRRTSSDRLAQLLLLVLALVKLRLSKQESTYKG